MLLEKALEPISVYYPILPKRQGDANVVVKTFTLFADKDTLRLDVAENGWAKLTLMG